MTSAVAFDSSSASALLTAIFEWFDQSGHLYCVQRNYQGYPSILTGDVDLVVSQYQTVSIAGEIRNLAESMGWNCYVEHAWNNTAHLGFYKPVSPNRFVLVIELFAGGGWHGIVYLSASDILSHRIRYGITWRPLPAHQAIITLIHHLLYNGHVPSKYRQEIISLVKEDTESFCKVLSKSFGNTLAEFTLKNIVSESWDVLASKVARYKLALVSRTYRTPIVFAKTLMQGYAALRRVPEGVILIVVDENYGQRESLCNALLEIADRWHIFLPPFRKIINYDTLFSEIKPHEIRLVCRIIRRGGVAILGCNMAPDIDIGLSHPPYKILCAKDECMVNVINKSFIKAPEHLEISEDNNMEYFAQQVWNFILMDRAQRNHGRFNDNQG